jgi:hypothetical protein
MRALLPAVNLFSKPFSLSLTSKRRQPSSNHDIGLLPPVQPCFNMDLPIHTPRPASDTPFYYLENTTNLGF